MRLVIDVILIGKVLVVMLLLVIPISLFNAIFVREGSGLHKALIMYIKAVMTISLCVVAAIVMFVVLEVMV